MEVQSETTAAPLLDMLGKEDNDVPYLLRTGRMGAKMRL